MQHIGKNSKDKNGKCKCGVKRKTNEYFISWKRRGIWFTESEYKNGDENSGILRDN